MKLQKRISTLVGIIIIVTVAIVAFVGVSAYQYFSKSQIPMTNVQPNPNSQNSNTETAGWKTYANTEYGFEIKYPPDSKIDDYSQDRWNNSKGLNVDLDIGVVDPERLDIKVSKVGTEPCLPDAGSMVKSEKEIDIDGVRAKEWRSAGFSFDGGNFDYTGICFEKGNYSYSIIGNNQANNQNYVEIMASTFKFIK